MVSHDLMKKNKKIYQFYIILRVVVPPFNCYTSVNGEANKQDNMMLA